METYACLYILRGDPFRPGTCVNLCADITEVGRTSTDNAPDVALTNIFISRKHLAIRKEGERAVAYDLGSRHGTELNGVKMIPHAPYVLETDDVLKLAKGTSVIHFSYAMGEQTLEFEPFALTSPVEESLSERVTIHWEKRECFVDGVKISMSEKEYLLLKLLHEHANRLVTIREIKQQVWQDRNLGEDGAPDVTIDELSALIYRIRKKYGRDTFLINAIRGNGYILET